MTESELWYWMMDGNYPPAWETDFITLDRRATATLLKDVKTTRWVGHNKPPKPVTLKNGSKVKVVMASRMGDVGITDNLNAHNGYIYRVQCVEDIIKVGDAEVKLSPENLLVDIKLIEDPRTELVKKAFAVPRSKESKNED